MYEIDLNFISIATGRSHLYTVEHSLMIKREIMRTITLPESRCDAFGALYYNNIFHCYQFGTLQYGKLISRFYSIEQYIMLYSLNTRREMLENSSSKYDGKLLVFQIHVPFWITCSHYKEITMRDILVFAKELNNTHTSYLRNVHISSIIYIKQ